LNGEQLADAVPETVAGALGDWRGNVSSLAKAISIGFISGE
jgi:hypothetical protein